jgi:hypothetical protein
MALFLRQNEDRSKLQERLAAELQEKARKKAETSELADGVTDSHYLKDTKSTTGLAGVWIAVVVIAVAAVVILMANTNQ